MILLSHSTITNWFWIASDGRIFSTAARGLIQSTDPSYVAWTAAGHLATHWPRDDDGAQTSAALDAVLADYGLSTGLTPPTKQQLRNYAFAKVTELLSTERSYDLGGVNVKCDATSVTAGNLSGLNAWAGAHPAASTQWVDNELTATTITATQAQTLAVAVSTYGQSIYNELGTVGASITDGSITTTAQIDSAAWPV